MAAYLVGHITVRDPGKWQEYLGRVGATISAGGGEVLFRGEMKQELSRSAPGRLIVAVRFPDLDALRRWHASLAYQSLIPIRDAAADVVLSAYEG